MNEFEEYLRRYRPVRAPSRLRGEAAAPKPSSPRWTTRAVAALAAAGLDHVQLSIQDTEAANADRIAGLNDAHLKKLAAAALVR